MNRMRLPYEFDKNYLAARTSTAQQISEKFPQQKMCFPFVMDSSASGSGKFLRLYFSLLADMNRRFEVAENIHSKRDQLMKYFIFAWHFW